MHRRFAAILPILLLSVGACDPESSDLDSRDDADDIAADADADLDVTAATAPRLLREVKLSDTHAVRFWVLEDGSGMVEEEFHADLDRGPALPQDGVQRNMAQLHSLVLPAEPVPAEVQQVDDRSAELADELLLAIDDDQASVSKPAPLDTLTAVEPEAQAACGAWDWEGDREWFLANYCIGTAQHKDCVANWIAINSWRHEVIWLGISVFNQSMEAPATVTAGHRKCTNNNCVWVQDFSEPIGNRKVRHYVSPAPGVYGVDIAGSGPCARVGMAQRWNTVSPPPPPPPPPPNPPGPCNYYGEACCSNTATATFYCNQTYDFQLYCYSGTCFH